MPIDVALEFHLKNWAALSCNVMEAMALLECQLRWYGFESFVVLQSEIDAFVTYDTADIHKK